MNKVSTSVFFTYCRLDPPPPPPRSSSRAVSLQVESLVGGEVVKSGREGMPQKGLKQGAPIQQQYLPHLNDLSSITTTPG